MRRRGREETGGGSACELGGPWGVILKRRGELPGEEEVGVGEILLRKKGWGMFARGRSGALSKASPAWP